MTITIQDAIAQFGVNVDEHLDRQANIPILADLQFQGDVAVVPQPHREHATTPVPSAGVAVVRSEIGGNTHLLLAAGTVFFDPATSGNNDLVLGTLTVPDGSTAFLAHPEHAYSGVAAGTYELRRQREQADMIRVVTD